MVYKKEQKLHEGLGMHDGVVKSPKAARLSFIRDIAAIFVVVMALAVMVVVIIDENANENELQQQLSDYRAERSASELEREQKLECANRYLDAIERNKVNHLILMGEFLVIISLSPPGSPERTERAKAKAKELDELNVQARKDAAAKIEYDNVGRPLPCPLPPTVPEESAS